MIELTYDVLEDTAELQLNTMKTGINDKYEILESFAEYISDNYPVSEEEKHAYSESMMSSCGFTSIEAADYSGIIYKADGTVTDVSRSSYFQKSIKGERYFMYETDGADGTDTNFIISVPLVIDNRYYGVIVGSFSKDTFSDLLKIETYNGEGYVFMCNTNGEVFMSTDHKNLIFNEGNLLGQFGKVTFNDGFTIYDLVHDFDTGAANTISYEYGNKKRYATYMTAGLSDLYIFSAVPTEAVNHVVTASFYQTLALVINLVLIFAFMFTFIMLRDKRKKQLLEQEKELLYLSDERHRLFENLSDSILFEGDLKTDSIHYNHNFEKILGHIPGLLKLSDFTKPSMTVHDDDMEQFLRFGASMKSGTARDMAEFRLLGNNGQYIWYRAKFMTVFDQSDDPVKIVGQLTDIDSETTQLLEIKDQAVSDSLTKLNNRMHIQEIVTEYIEGNGKNLMHAFLIIDIDDFKKINDTLGHFQGDNTLTTFADMLKRVFPTCTYISRTGGDEFAAFVKNIPSPEYAARKAQEIVESTRTLNFDECGDLRFSCSVGIAIYPNNGDTFDDLFKKSDIALYVAKMQGKNRYSLYDSSTFPA
jgi:diguanylate cyclase (GGDEF)-like protein